MVETRSVIQKGSKSFFLASLFFDSRTKKACWDLYQWCRYCDDQIDQAADRSASRQALQKLRLQWQQAESGSPQFHLVRTLERAYQIPESYFLDLLKGLEMDVEGRNYRSLRDLEDYSYHVAGVVGVKMSYIMGVSDTKAFRHAIDLGIAMQLTNIARDVQEDFSNGRVYIPEEWLAERRIPKTCLLDLHFRDSLFQVVMRLLERADELYQEGYRGLRYLPWRAAFAVASAAEIYAQIGRKIRRGGPMVISQRVYVSKLEKLALLFKGFQRMIWSRYERS